MQTVSSDIISDIRDIWCLRGLSNADNFREVARLLVDNFPCADNFSVFVISSP